MSRVPKNGIYQTRKQEIFISFLCQWPQAERRLCPVQGAGEGWNRQWHTGEQVLGRGCAKPQALLPLPSAAQAAGQAQAMLVQEQGGRRLGTFGRGMMAHPGVSWRGLHKPLCQNKLLTPGGAMLHTASRRRLAPENCGNRISSSSCEPCS